MGGGGGGGFSQPIREFRLKGTGKDGNGGKENRNLMAKEDYQKALSDSDLGEVEGDKDGPPPPAPAPPRPVPTAAGAVDAAITTTAAAAAATASLGDPRGVGVAAMGGGRPLLKQGGPGWTLKSDFAGSGGARGEGGGGGTDAVKQ